MQLEVASLWIMNSLGNVMTDTYVPLNQQNTPYIQKTNDEYVTAFILTNYPHNEGSSIKIISNVLRNEQVNYV